MLVPLFLFWVWVGHDVVRSRPSSEEFKTSDGCILFPRVSSSGGTVVPGAACQLALYLAAYLIRLLAGWRTLRLAGISVGPAFLNRFGRGGILASKAFVSEASEHWYRFSGQVRE